MVLLRRDFFCRELDGILKLFRSGAAALRHVRLSASATA
jgi:hypothetical protein